MHIRTRVITLFALIMVLGACSDNKQPLTTLVHADTGSYSAAISPDRKYLVTGSTEGFGRLWDLENNRVLYSVQHQENDQGGILAAAFSARGDVLVTIEQQSIARWSIADGKLTGFWSWPNLTDIDISADGRYVLIGSKDNQAVYFDMLAGKMVHVFAHHDKVTSVALSADGRFALTGSNDWHASLWDLKTGEHLWAKNMKYKIALVELSDDGTLALANAFIGAAHIYATADEGKLIAKLDANRMTLISADFSDDGRLLATGRASKSIDIWHVASGKSRESWQPTVKHLVQPDSATILDLKLDTDARTLVSESSTGIGQTWALK